MASDPGAPRSTDSGARPGDQVVLNEAVDSESVEALTGHLVPDQVVDTTWRRQDAVAAKRATLRVYLGAAPGVGKTYAMLGEAQRRRSRGTDVVVGYVQTYGRPHTAEMLDGLEVVPTRAVDYRGTAFQEMDAAAVIARALRSSSSTSSRTRTSRGAAGPSGGRTSSTSWPRGSS